MKQILILLIFGFGVNLSLSQVGVNTTDPKATLEVKGEPSDIAIVDGIIAPRITRENLIAKTGYTTAQTGAIVYITDLSGTVNASTDKIREIGYYYFNGSTWNSMNYGSRFSNGDTKQGFQSSDHIGWIKLDGRAISSLTITQQANATLLGFTINLPNATNAFLVQNGTALGSINGSNNKTINQTNLPNVNFLGSTSSAGSHTHTGSIRSAGSANGSASGSQPWTLGGFTSLSTYITLNSAGDHTHTATVSSGGSGTPLDMILHKEV
jgi:hypothetical protein